MESGGSWQASRSSSPMPISLVSFLCCLASPLWFRPSQPSDGTVHDPPLVVAHCRPCPAKPVLGDLASCRPALAKVPNASADASLVLQSCRSSFGKLERSKVQGMWLLDRIGLDSVFLSFILKQFWACLHPCASRKCSAILRRRTACSLLGVAWGLVKPRLRFPLFRALLRRIACLPFPC